MMRYLTIAPRIGVIIPMRTNKEKMKNKERMSNRLFLFLPEGKMKASGMANSNTKFSIAEKKTGMESDSHTNGRKSTVKKALGIC